MMNDRESIRYFFDNYWEPSLRRNLAEAKNRQAEAHEAMKETWEAKREQDARHDKELVAMRDRLYAAKYELLEAHERVTAIESRLSGFL